MINLFQKYGIKEVSDVTFYSITQIGDEEFYTPVLFLDTLKVTTLTQSASKITNSGGYGDQIVIGWNRSKQIDLRLEDCLCSQASLNLSLGWLQSRLSAYTSAIAKINLANKYALLNYSTYAYPSPQLTDEEWEVIFFSIRGLSLNDLIKSGLTLTYEFINEPYVAATRIQLKKYYKNRNLIISGKRYALPEMIITLIYKQITYMEQFGKIDSDNYDFEVIDRLENCFVENKNGMTIDLVEQYDNLLKYYKDDRSSTYYIYYDPKTMQPLLLKQDNKTLIPQSNETIWLKEGTQYYKWSRTVKPKFNDTSILGKTLVINATTFPSKYKIVGETYIREQRTQKDSRYQFTINRAVISPETEISLSADGDPTTFSFDITALSPQNELMMELKQFDVTEDTEHGGTKILPVNTSNSYTPVDIDRRKVTIENDEIY